MHRLECVGDAPVSVAGSVMFVNWKLQLADVHRDILPLNDKILSANFVINF